MIAIISTEALKDRLHEQPFRVQGCECPIVVFSL
jgi:hypothetical protein